MASQKVCQLRIVSMIGATHSGAGTKAAEMAPRKEI
jgi:hypothetical protein